MLDRRRNAVAGISHGSQDFVGQGQRIEGLAELLKVSFRFCYRLLHMG